MKSKGNSVTRSIVERFSQSIGEWRGALESLRRTETLNPREAAFVVNIVASLKDRGRYEDAMALIHMALGTSPNDATLWIELGKLQRDVGRTDDALASFTRATRIDDNNAYAFSLTGLMLEQMGDLRAALDCHKRALELAPDSAIYALCVGKILYGLGDFLESERYYRRAEQNISRETLYNQACLDALLGRPDIALRKLNAFIKRNPFARFWAAEDPDLASLRDLPGFPGENAAPESPWRAH